MPHRTALAPRSEAEAPSTRTSSHTAPAPPASPAPPAVLAPPSVAVTRGAALPMARSSMAAEAGPHMVRPCCRAKCGHSSSGTGAGQRGAGWPEGAPLAPSPAAPLAGERGRAEAGGEAGGEAGIGARASGGSGRNGAAHAGGAAS
eukprot:scaffold30358_cov65-Phaeocystis_antarctica.AAC.3